MSDLLPYALIGLAFAALLAWLHRATRPAHPAVSWAAEPTPRQWVDATAIRRVARCSTFERRAFVGV